MIGLELIAPEPAGRLVRQLLQRGVIAIPEAFNQYTALYGALLEQLYADPAFREACSTH